MKCAHCGRPLKRPAARIGRLCFGAVCARRLALLAPPSVRQAVCDVRRRAERDVETVDMFEGVAA